VTGQQQGMTRRQLIGAGMAGVTVGAVSPVLALPMDRAGAADEQEPEGRHGRVREYWIQVDSVEHNLVPTGYDQMSGQRFSARDTSFWALGYRAYTPGWAQPLAGDELLGPNRGIPGPIIRAEVGDRVLVHFRNNDTHYRWPHSMHTHGFRYDPGSDGAYVDIRPTTPGTAVMPGESYTYTWTAVPTSVGTWLYHDHAAMTAIGAGPPIMEFNAELGMFGHAVITDRHTSRVDREFFLFFHDAYQSHIPTLSQDFDCFNGTAYLGNTPTFTARVGEKVRWRVASLGKEFHVFHIHGHRWKNTAGSWTDSEILGPSTTLTVEYTEDNPGQWLYHCHVTDHMNGGMVGAYKVGI
jgi:FtsP/CotA-like multicopper oxidase with cupredoxin domain